MPRPAGRDLDVNGVALCTATGNKILAGIVSDGPGGRLVAGLDFRTDTLPTCSTLRANAGQWTRAGP